MTAIDRADPIVAGIDMGAFRNKSQSRKPIISALMKMYGARWIFLHLNRWSFRNKIRTLLSVDDKRLHL